MSARVLSQLRTFGIVSVLAALVWVVAESESLADERFEAAVSLLGDDQAGLIMVPVRREAWTGRVVIDLAGGAAAISRLREPLRAGFVLEPGQGAVPIEPGRHVLDLTAAVRSLPAFQGSGISIVSVEPEQIEVEIVRLITRDIDIAVRLPEGLDVSSVVAEPRRARLTYPDTAAAAIDRGAEIIAEVSAAQSDNISVGSRSVIRDVPLLLPDVLTGNAFASVEPASVSVIATLEQREDSVTLDAVPVRIQRPAFQAERWIVRVDEADQLLSGVVVTGPSDLIARIRSNELRIFATVSLTPDDLDSLIDEKAVTLGELPTPLRFETEQTVVGLQIEPAPVE
ncbi:MAG: hypothetical protein AAGJ54_07875 [Planctomycetota bacterium]